MTRDEAEALLEEYVAKVRANLWGTPIPARKQRLAVIDAMTAAQTADQERPVTETEPAENDVVLVPWPDHDLPWRAAFRLRGRWWYYDSNMAASPAPTVYRPMPPPRRCRTRWGGLT